MKAETRQTVIGVVCMSAVQVVAVNEGFNAAVFGSYILGVVALVTPEALSALPWSGKEGL